MYTLILMTAMSTAPNAAEFGGGLFHRKSETSSGSCTGSCTGCNGCYGSCYGKSSGCYGQVEEDRGFGHRIRAFFNPGSSCYGSGTTRSGGCYGSCTGQSLSCQGASLSCMGCLGGGIPPGYEFAPPSQGVPFSPTAPAVSFAPPSATGPDCCGTANTLGAPTPVGSAYPTIQQSAAFVIHGSPAPMPPTVVQDNPSTRQVTFAPPGAAPTDNRARATVVVRLPADAILFAEGRQLTLTSAERTFVTPPLPLGTDYNYSFRVEYVRDGESISQGKRVAVRPGSTSTVEFVDLTLARSGAKEPSVKPSPIPTQSTSVIKPETGTIPTIPAVTPTITPPVSPPALRTSPVATDRARITVKLPPGAVLYVDGKKSDRTEAIREFSTPPLPPGQEFAYVMKAEVMREGRPESQMTKVTFRSGELVTVDFTAPPVR